MKTELEQERPALIAIVEDDRAVAGVIEQVLIDFSFRTVLCRNAKDLLRRLGSLSPDLCIIDLGLPDMDGIELMQRVRAESSCGILILTGRAYVSDRVMGLELGADDYVLKPFEPRELVARVRSILRRRAGASGSAPGQQRRHASFLGWSLDCAANILRAADGSEHLLGTAETQVLRAFVERPHQILTREQLIGQRDLSPLDRSIDVRISRLRRKLESDPQNPKIIKTVYGAGYMFSAAVTWS